MSYKIFLHFNRGESNKNGFLRIRLLNAVLVCLIVSVISFTKCSFAFADGNYNFKVITDCLVNNSVSSSSESECLSLPSIRSDIKSIVEKKSFTTGDLTAMLKAMAVLGINLFLVIVSSIASILKAVLPFLK